MKDQEIAQKFVNQFAKALQILNRASEQQLHVLCACSEYDSIFEKVWGDIENTQKSNPTVLLDTIDKLLQEATEQPDAIRFSYATAICQCMDKCITFVSLDSVWNCGKISLHSLVPIQSDIESVLLSELNKNKEETGICLIPKFPVSIATTSNHSALKTRSLNSRDAMYGINGWLSNVGYYPWNILTPNVGHIILADRSSQSNEHVLPEVTRIIFTPVSDRSDLLKLSNPFEQNFYGMPCNAVGVSGITDTEYVEKRFKDCWMAASHQKADIFFGPEMLATENMVKVVNDGSSFLKPLLNDALRQGLTPPRLTIMPTFWKDGKNTAYVFDEMGMLCGKQDKGTPFVNVKKGWVEALTLDENPDVLLIHMQNQQRIAIVICAEFLANSKHVGEFLCGKLGATLILVPSYSMGEQDFVNGLSTLKPYGTSVVWGNCCGAPCAVDDSGKRIIGGGSFAGIDAIYRMGSVCTCGFKCKDGESCLFKIEIPRNIKRSKPDSPQASDFIHICQ